MIGKGVFRCCDKGGETFSVPRPEVAIPAGEYIGLRNRLTVFSRIMNCKWLQIGAVCDEDTSVHRAEGMDRLRRHRETEVRQSRPGDIDMRNGQDEMIDRIRFQLNGLRGRKICPATKARR